MAAAGVPMRTLQEWLGHRDSATTLIYADYALSAHEAEWIERAFSVTPLDSRRELASPGPVADAGILTCAAG